jgi:competence protein ComEC
MRQEVNIDRQGTRCARRGQWPAWLFLLALFPALLGAAKTAQADTVKGQLKIYVLNIGQGDAILIMCPHKQPHFLLIDSGARSYPKSQEAFHQLLQTLVPGNKARLDVVVATHPHEDHIGGMAWVLENFQVAKFVDNGKPYTSTFAQVRKDISAQSKNNSLTYIDAGKDLSAKIADFCPASNLNSELLIPQGFGKASNVNNNSVVVRVTYNQLSFLFTGDAETQEEALLLKDSSIEPRLHNVIFYKVGHHGAETSTNPPLLGAMTPQWAAISSGAKNVSKNKGYRHPRARTLDALLGVITADAALEPRTVDAGEAAKAKWTTRKIHKRIYVTTKDGTLLFVSDGKTFAHQSLPTGLPDPVGHH